MNNIGFSTGAIYKDCTIKQALALFRKLNLDTVELGLLKMERLEGQLEEITKEDLETFASVSIHAPTIAYGKNKETEYVFGKIEKIIKLHPVDLVVFHPDTVLDFSVFNNLPFEVGFENMDNRKEKYKTVEEMKALLTNPDWKMVFDINHAFSNDPTLESAKEMIDIFKDKIKEIHLSGYNGYHEPLFETKQNELLKIIEHFNVPIIIESLLTPDTLKEELIYIRKNLII